VLPAVTIAFLSKLLQSEYYKNAIDGINTHKMLRMLIPLLRIPHFTASHPTSLNVSLKTFEKGFCNKLRIK